MRSTVLCKKIHYNVPIRAVWEILNMNPRAQGLTGSRSIFTYSPDRDVITDLQPGYDYIFAVWGLN